ncbi:MAG: DUF4142 domain-containing protein [Burkholderiales bacterium]|nr:DUF4142 domain-containing protein [Burkholderiales bacterium]
MKLTTIFDHSVLCTGKAVAATAVIAAFSLSAYAADTPASVSAADKQFMVAAAHAGATEITASKDAARKASTAQVKEFADQMVTDHTKVADELKQLASSKKVDIPDKPDAKQETTIKKLSVLEGQKYERQYATDIGVAAHKDAVALFKKASTSAQDPDVKAFATKTLPSLEHHLKMSEDMKAKLDK